MAKNFFKFGFSILFLLLVLIAAHSAIFAQKKSEIASGEYEPIVLAVNAEGELTGYLEEGAGYYEKDDLLNSCRFFIHGERQADGTYKIMTWYPSDAGDKVVEGELKAVNADGKKLINLHLNGNHNGCWRVSPSLKETEGEDYKLTTAANWESIRVVSAAKTFFYASAQAKTPQKVFVVKNDVVRVLQTKGDAAEVSFVNDKGKTTKGWIKTKDFYATAPPAIKN